MENQQQINRIHASIHEIVSQNKKALREQQINQLFSSPQLTELDTSQFQRHPYMKSNQLYTFFVQELQKWNKKIRNKQVTTFYLAQLKKYNFIHSSLKIISLKKTNQITRYLQQMSMWYSKNSYNIPQPSVLMKKYDLSEEWQVRRTFKSNTSSEIKNYRRKFLCSPDDKSSDFTDAMLGISKKNENCFFQHNITQKTKAIHLTWFEQNLAQSNYKNSQSSGPLSQILKNKQTRLVIKENSQIRQSRQESQIKQFQNEWKKTRNRFGKKSCLNFYKGNFNANKHFSEPIVQARKIFTATYNTRHTEQEDLIKQVKKKRLQTSLGMRRTQDQNLINLEEKTMNIRTQCNEETKDDVNCWIDNFVVDEDKLSIINTIDRSGTGMRLISNPFDAVKSKIKRKKK